jgi:hypothetical protein
LCSRARKVSERSVKRKGKGIVKKRGELSGVVDEIPFARRARESGRVFSGGKSDGESSMCFVLVRAGVLILGTDISVVVAVISPAMENL